MNSKTKLKLKPIIDILMTFALLLLMSYELLGSTAHEVVGVAMFVLFVVQAAIKSWYFAETNFVFVLKSFSVQPISFLPVAILAVAVSIAESNAETTHWSQLSHVPKWSAQSAPI